MIKKYFTLVLMLLVSILTKAQEKKEAFEKAVDHCNCKMTYAYLIFITSTMPKDSPEIASFEKIKSFGKCDVQKLLSYSELSNLLDGNNFPSSNRIFSSVINKIKDNDSESLSSEQATTKIIEGIYSNKALSKIFQKHPDIRKLKEPLKTDVAKILGKAFSDNSINSNEEKPKNEKRLNEIEKKLTEIETGQFTLQWLSISLIVFLSFVAVFVVLTLKLLSLEKKTKIHRDEIDTLQLAKGGSTNIEETKRSISDLSSKITKLQNEISLLTSNSHQKSFSDPALTPTVLEKQQKQEVSFAPIPNRDGSFNANSVLATENQSSSYYKFTITDSNALEASFEFLNTEKTVTDAKTSPDLILNPVCKIKNALNRSAKKIRTVKSGIVRKQNDKWVVSQLAEIEYE